MHTCVVIDKVVACRHRASTAMLATRAGAKTLEEGADSAIPPGWAGAAPPAPSSLAPHRSRYPSCLSALRPCMAMVAAAVVGNRRCSGFTPISLGSETGMAPELQHGAWEKMHVWHTRQLPGYSCLGGPGVFARRAIVSSVSAVCCADGIHGGCSRPLRNAHPGDPTECLNLETHTHTCAGANRGNTDAALPHSIVGRGGDVG